MSTYCRPSCFSLSFQPTWAGQDSLLVRTEDHRSRLSKAIYPSLLIREVLRAVSAFALSLIVYWLWLATGLEGAYDSLLVSLSSAAVHCMQHFPTFGSIREMR